MNKSGNFVNFARQGDVFLERVDSVPEGAKPVGKDKDRIVLAFGEATGHAHAIYSPGKDAVLMQLKGDLNTYLKVKRTVELRHEEHGPVKIAPGVYKIIQQREYSPGELPRNVAD